MTIMDIYKKYNDDSPALAGLFIMISIYALFFSIWFTWNTYIIYIKIAGIVVITEVIYLNCVNHLMIKKEKFILKLKSIGLGLFVWGIFAAFGWIGVVVIKLLENYFEQTIIGLMIIVCIVIWFLINMILPIRKN